MYACVDIVASIKDCKCDYQCWWQNSSSPRRWIRRSFSSAGKCL